MTALPPNKRSWNTILWDLGLFPHKTVAENVVYGLKVRGVDAVTRRKVRRPCSALLPWKVTSGAGCTRCPEDNGKALLLPAPSSWNPPGSCSTSH